MKSNKEILDEFGKLLISEVYDSLYNNIGKVISGEAKKYNRLELRNKLKMKYKLLAKCKFENSAFQIPHYA
jgi:hypothetical protein